MNEANGLDPETEKSATIIVDCAFKVHSTLGPGLLESIYEKCLIHELERAGVRCRRQVSVPIAYDNTLIGEGFRIDLLVEESIIVELKSIETILPVHEAQILTCLKLTHKRLGFLINFNVPLIKQGIRRFVR